MNLRYHVQRPFPAQARVAHLDWYNEAQVTQHRNAFAPHWIVGSDVIYEPTDLPYLCRTLERFWEHPQCQRIVLVSPHPTTNQRQALPTFQEWLQEQQNAGRFHVTTKEYTVVQTSASNGAQERERFFLWSLTRP